VTDNRAPGPALELAPTAASADSSPLKRETEEAMTVAIKTQVLDLIRRLAEQGLRGAAATDPLEQAAPKPPAPLWREKFGATVGGVRLLVRAQELDDGGIELRAFDVGASLPRAVTRVSSEAARNASGGRALSEFLEPRPSLGAAVPSAADVSSVASSPRTSSAVTLNMTLTCAPHADPDAVWECLTGFSGGDLEFCQWLSWDAAPAADEGEVHMHVACGFPRALPSEDVVDQLIIAFVGTEGSPVRGVALRSE